jgi:hypothetical protein
MPVDFAVNKEGEVVIQKVEGATEGKRNRRSTL